MITPKMVFICKDKPCSRGLYICCLQCPDQCEEICEEAEIFWMDDQDEGPFADYEGCGCLEVEIHEPTEIKEATS